MSGHRWPMKVMGLAMALTVTAQTLAMGLGAISLTLWVLGIGAATGQIAVGCLGVFVLGVVISVPLQMMARAAFHAEKRRWATLLGIDPNQLPVSAGEFLSLDLGECRAAMADDPFDDESAGNPYPGDIGAES